eukprot:3848734-Karenia_brevis.AAC.1
MFASAVSIRWPDVSIWELPVFGGPPVGPLKPFGIFRKKMHPAERLPEELLKDADAWVCQLINSSPPPVDKAEIIFEKSQSEVDKGWISGWFTKDIMDAKYGTNGWLPMQRFALWQDNHGAWRVIDN